jgi:glutamyl-Q tRNA(Asp) synthetase
VSGEKNLKFRFAPSPNGLLHLGHAYSAIKSFEMAKQMGAAFHLRIEDIDGARSEDSFKAAIIRDLHWLGLKWQAPVLYQSNHFHAYQKALDELLDADLLYPCFATRSEIKKAHEQNNRIEFDPDGAPLYPGIYKTYSKEKAKERIAKGEPYALRLHMNKAIKRAKEHLNSQNSTLIYQTFNEIGECGQVPIHAERWGDVVIKRKDTPTSYHLAVVVDDHQLGVTHICRGQDLQASTDIHTVLQLNLGLISPLYHHHDLVLIKGQKLSKSKAHPSIFDLRAKGITAKEIYDAALIRPEALSKFLP